MQGASTPGAYTYPLTIADILDSAIATRSAALIVGSDDQRRTYGQFSQRVRRLGSSLSRLGIQHGETVAVMDWDSHRYLEFFFAVPMLGAILQTVNVRLSHDQLVHVMGQTRPVLLFANGDFQELVGALAEGPRRGVVLMTDDTKSITSEHLSVVGADTDYETMLAGGDPDFVFPLLDENSLATTFHTSGTTGLPKAVAFSHRQLVLHTLAATAALALQPAGQGLSRDDVYMPITPMFHVHAWGLPYVATMLGLKQVYPGRYRADRLLALQRRERVTFSHGVPTIVTMLLDALGDDRIDGRWTMMVGGSSLSLALHRRARDRGIDTLTGYGMSETAPLVALSRHAIGDAEHGEDSLRRAGRPLPLVKVRTVDATGADTVKGAAGELVIRAPWLTQSYGGDPVASEALWSGGWLHTGDIAEVGDTGDVAIVDRLKDVIKTGGEWVSSAQIEDLLLLHSAIMEAAVIGVPDDRWGERPLAFVVTTEEPPAVDVLQDHLRTFVRDGLISAYAVPDRIVLQAALPCTSVGKIDKKALRSIALDRITPSGL